MSERQITATIRLAAPVVGEMALAMEKRSVRLSQMRDWATRLRRAANELEKQP